LPTLGKPTIPALSIIVKRVQHGAEEDLGQESIDLNPFFGKDYMRCDCLGVTLL